MAGLCCRRVAAVTIAIWLVSSCPACADWDVVEYQEPGPPAAPPNVTYIGWYARIRFFGTFVPGTNISAETTWVVPLVGKLALLAWQRGDILDPPASKAPVDFRFLYVDEWRSPAEGGQGRAMRIAQQMMMGNELLGQQFPAVRAILGGIMFTSAIAKLAEAMQVPNMGFYTGSDSFSDKTQYPMFLRTNAPDAALVRATLKVISKFGFSKAVAWLCRDSQGLLAAERDSFMTEAQKFSIAVTPVVIDMTTTTGCEPDDPTTRAGWYQAYELARLSGAHAQICWQSDHWCSAYDIQHWLAMKGLVSRGFLWIGRQNWLQTLYRTYTALIPLSRCKVAGTTDQFTPTLPATTPKAFDGHIAVVPDLTAGPLLQRWWTWVQSLRAQKDKIFEPWYASEIPDSAWASLKAEFWKGQYALLAFDAGWSLLRGINNLQVKVGSNFTGQQLLETVRNDSFRGLTGMVKFDKNGDRVQNISIWQWRVGCTVDLFMTRRLSAEQVSPAAPTTEPRLEAEIDALAARWAPADPRRAASKCTPPADPTKLADLGAYLTCLATNCEDAAPAVLAATSGGAVPDCPRAKALVTNCETDLSAMGLPVPAGTKLKTVCPAQCACGSPTTASSSSTTTRTTTSRAAGGATTTRNPALAPAGRENEMGFVEVGSVFDDVTFSRPLYFFGCSTDVPPVADLACDPGQFYDSDSASCLNCTAGTASTTVGQSSCTPCPGGTYSSSEGQSQCLACQGGRYSGNQATSCKSCESGKYNADVQQTLCLNCTAGKYAESTGTTDCLRCPLGSHQSLMGQSSCNLCPAPKVTLVPGMLTEANCTCPEGWYYKGSVCQSCDVDFPLDTVFCAGDKEPPIVHEGFMTLTGSDVVYKCAARGGACPGNVPVGTELCTLGGSQVACSLCDAGYSFDVKEGACVPCSAAATGIFWALVVLAFGGLVVKLRPTEVEYSSRSLQKIVQGIFVMVPVTQFCDLFQFHAILGRSALRWPSNSGKTFNAFSGLFDLNVFAVECWLGGDKDTYPLRYVLLMNLLPAFLLTACLLLTLPVLLNKNLKQYRFPDPLPAASTALAVVLMFFLTILNWALNLVFSSYPHPGGAGRSLVAFPHVLTTDSIMGGMKAIAIISILIWCVGTFALVTFLLYLLPKRRENMFLRRCTLNIVARYSENAACWVLVDLSVKILTCITLSIFDDADSQLVWLGCIYTVYHLATCVVQPFRFMRHALFDIVLTFSKVLLLIFASPLLLKAAIRAQGVAVVTYFSYGLAASFCLWCFMDHWRNRSCDVEQEENLFAHLQRKITRYLPVLHSIEEVAATPEAMNMGITRHSVSVKQSVKMDKDAAAPSPEADGEVPPAMRPATVCL